MRQTEGAVRETESQSVGMASGGQPAGGEEETQRGAAEEGRRKAWMVNRTVGEGVGIHSRQNRQRIQDRGRGGRDGRSQSVKMSSGGQPAGGRRRHSGEQQRRDAGRPGWSTGRWVKEWASTAGRTDRGETRGREWSDAPSEGATFSRTRMSEQETKRS